jgi:hypothetical protein
MLYLKIFPKAVMFDRRARCDIYLSHVSLSRLGRLLLTLASTLLAAGALSADAQPELNYAHRLLLRNLKHASSVDSGSPWPCLAAIVPWAPPCQCIRIPSGVGIAHLDILIPPKPQQTINNCSQASQHQYLTMEGTRRSSRTAKLK